MFSRNDKMAVKKHLQPFVPLSYIVVGISHLEYDRVVSKHPVYLIIPLKVNRTK